VVVLAVAASTAQAAQAKPACPTLTDEAGDAGAFGYHVQQDVSDITSVDVSTGNKTLTASVTVVGEPVNNEPGVSRLYEVHFDTGERGYVLRASLGNGETRFQLVVNDHLADSGLGTTVEHFQPLKAVQGHVAGHTVTISAPLDRDLPLLGRRVNVFGRTLIAEANEVSAGGMRTPQGVVAGLDGTDVGSFRVGDRGCA
jgi:hypothetical protein